MKYLATFFALLLVLCGAGCSGSSNSFNAPSDFTVVSSATQIKLKWKPVAAVIGYSIYRSTASGAVSSKIALATELSATQYLDASALPGVSYFYQVVAVNSTGDSQASPEAQGLIKAAAPGSTLVGGTVQGSALTLGNEVTTLAGSAAGFADGTGTAALFRLPYGITTDGKNLYVADTVNHAIRQIVIGTGVVTTLAGSTSAVSGTADGTGSAARFNDPIGITTDGTSLYVADFSNHMIRRILIATGEVTTVAGAATLGSADGVGAVARFKNPEGITTDGTNLYVTDSGNHTIRKIVIASGAVTTLAGTGLAGAVDGAGTAASFATPAGIITDGSKLYLTDSANHNIRQIVLASGAVSTLAGSVTSGSSDGTGSAARFNAPVGITSDGINLYVADSNNNLIRQVVIASGAVTTIAGSGTAGKNDGLGSAATFSLPNGITTDGVSLFVTDLNFSLIRQIF